MNKKLMERIQELAGLKEQEISMKQATQLGQDLAKVRGIGRNPDTIQLPPIKVELDKGGVLTKLFGTDEKGQKLPLEIKKPIWSIILKDLQAQGFNPSVISQVSSDPLDITLNPDGSVATMPDSPEQFGKPKTYKLSGDGIATIKQLLVKYYQNN